jgi:hypothetical protein
VLSGGFIVAVIKWFFIVIGGLVLLTMVGCVGIVGGSAALVNNAVTTAGKDAPKLTSADLEVGGAYQGDERETLVNACQKAFGTKIRSESKLDRLCDCVADVADDRSSRYDRLIMTIALDAAGQDWSQALKVGIGLANAGLSKSEMDGANRKSKARSSMVLRTCFERLQ